MSPDEAQRRATAITFLRTANVERVPTDMLLRVAAVLREYSAFITPPAPKPDRCAHGYLLAELRDGTTSCDRCEESVTPSAK